MATLRQTRGEYIGKKKKNLWRFPFQTDSAPICRLTLGWPSVRSHVERYNEIVINLPRQGVGGKSLAVSRVYARNRTHDYASCAPHARKARNGKATNQIFIHVNHNTWRSIRCLNSSRCPSVRATSPLAVRYAGGTLEDLSLLLTYL